MKNSLQKTGHEEIDLLADALERKVSRAERKKQTQTLEESLKEQMRNKRQELLDVLKERFPAAFGSGDTILYEDLLDRIDMLLVEPKVQSRPFEKANLRKMGDNGRISARLRSSQFR